MSDEMFEYDPLFRDKEGNPLDVQEWGAKFKDLNYRVIGSDIVGPYRISTIWLGMQHWGNKWFETIVFEGDESLEMDRYTTEQKAILGHKAMVAMMKEKYEAGEKVGE